MPYNLHFVELGQNPTTCCGDGSSERVFLAFYMSKDQTNSIQTLKEINK